jgi:hypothetical protein
VKGNFPFSDYDFYAYLSSGLVALFSIDVAATGGRTMLRADWTAVQVALVIGVAYGAGHIIAMISQTVLERGLARRVLYSPTAVLTGLVRPSGLRGVIGRLLVGHYYDALPEGIRDRIIHAASFDLGAKGPLTGEAIFQAAFVVARANPDTAIRLDSFRNQYGFCRNMAIATAIGAVALALQGAPYPPHTWVYVTLLAAFSAGMTLRYLKFYFAYSMDALRAYAFKAT